MMDGKGMRISDKYSLAKDRYNWILTEYYDVVSKEDGSIKEGSRHSYHAKLSQVANHLVDNQECYSIDEYIEKGEQIKRAVEALLVGELDD